MRDPVSNHEAVDMLRESTLPGVERAVLTEIAHHFPNMWPSINRIVRHTGFARTTVIEALEKLETQGYIDKISAKITDTQRFGFANRYTIHWEKLQEAAPENTRTATTRLRQELAEAKRALWNNSQPDHGRESAPNSADLVRETGLPSTGGGLPPSTGGVLGSPDLVREATRPSTPDNPDLVRQPDPNKGHKEIQKHKEIPTAKQNPSRQAARKSEPPFVLPDWVPIEEWKFFEEMREKLHKPMTSHAKELIVGKLAEFRDKGDPPAEVLNQSIAASWLSVFALKRDQGSRKPPASEKTGKPDYGKWSRA